MIPLKNDSCSAPSSECVHFLWKCLQTDFLWPKSRYLLFLYCCCTSYFTFRLFTVSMKLIYISWKSSMCCMCVTRHKYYFLAFSGWSKMVLKWLWDHVAVWNTPGWTIMLEDMGEACVYCSQQSVIVRTGNRVGHTQVGDHVRTRGWSLDSMTMR